MPNMRGSKKVCLLSIYMGFLLKNKGVNWYFKDSVQKNYRHHYIWYVKCFYVKNFRFKYMDLRQQNSLFPYSSK